MPLATSSTTAAFTPFSSAPYQGPTIQVSANQYNFIGFFASPYLGDDVLRFILASYLIDQLQPHPQLASRDKPGKPARRTKPYCHLL
jgi:hypothetical protein